MNLSDWLKQHGLDTYEAVFAEEGFDDIDSLRDLTEDDLEKLGLKMAHRKKLLKALQVAASVAPEAPEAPAPSGTIPSTEPKAARRYKLFLSYGRDDYVEEARTLRDALRARGHEVWFDEEQLASGLDWEQRIEKGLASCDRVVLTMTPHSVRRPDGYCLNELAKALELRKLIIPVLMVDVPQGAPTSICRIQYLDWRDAVPARERAERFSRRLQRLCEAIEEDKLDFEGGQQRLMRHLQPLSYDGDIQHHVARFMGRRRLEARLRAWMDDPAAPQRLWLTAAPGMGKSAVAATLAHRWGETAAVHFCVAGHQDKADPARAILSLAYQLATHLDLYRARLASLDLEREAEKDERTLFDTLLVGPLARDFPAPERPWLVILDGLDEATRSDGSNALAEVVAADWSRLPAWLRLLVSSRPEAEVQQWLAGTASVELRGDDEEQREDVAAYLRGQLAAMGKAVSEAALSRILQRSEGAFHYAVLLVEEVRQGRCDPEDPVDLPAGLNQIYLQSFRRRFAHLATYRQETRPLLELMLAAPEPVPLALLADATGSEVRDVRECLAQLGALVLIEPGVGESDPQWDTVRPSHASLRSWLTGLDPQSRLPLAGPYAAEAAARRLAAIVLARWDAQDRSEATSTDPNPRCKGFVARTLWPLLKAVPDPGAMERVAMDLSRHWQGRKLALALEPGTFAAERTWSHAQAPSADAATLTRCLGHLEHLGDLQELIGRTAGQLETAQRQLTLARRLAERDPGHPDGADALAVAHRRVAEALRAQGALDSAQAALEESTALLERCCEAHPDDPDRWSRLGDGLTELGITLQLRGEFDSALRHYRRHLEIVQRLAAQDPLDTGRQKDLGRGHGLVGGLLFAQGDHEGALAEHRRYAQIFEALLEQEPDHRAWLQDFGFSHHHMGAVLEAMGRLDEALQEHRLYARVMDRLVGEDADNAAYLSDLALSQTRIAGVLLLQGQHAQALEVCRRAAALFGRLKELDPENAFSHREAAVAQANMAHLHLLMRDAPAATAACERALPMFDALRRSATPSSLVDWAAIHALGAEIGRQAGDDALRTRHDAALIDAEVPPQGVTGPFRLRLAPLILERLAALLDRCEPVTRARLALRGLRLAPRFAAAEAEAWRARALQAQQGLAAGDELAHALVTELQRQGSEP
mgnify:CR=1 FL=1